MNHSAVNSYIKFVKNFRKIDTNNLYLVNILNVFFIAVLFLLPYYLFDGKLFVGGDDTRLIYIYPLEWLKNSAFFSWANVSSVGFNNPNQHQLPFILVWFGLDRIFQNKVFIDYLAFSAPIIFGFIYVQRFSRELVRDLAPFFTFVGAVFFTLSPIIAINQLSVFLNAAWLIGGVPVIAFYFLKYLKTSKFLNILKAMFIGIFFSIAFYNIPWILGLFFPFLAGLFLSFFIFPKKNVFSFVRKSFIFFSILILSQSFWVIPFVSIFVDGGSSYGGIITSISSTFVSTVLSAATGNIFYPLLNLFHRQIIMDFSWQSEVQYLNFYDKIVMINTLYVVTLIAGAVCLRKTSKSFQKIFLLFLSAFIFSLFIFTVNIGPLKEVFLIFKFFPLAASFRNFYDKFALGFVMIYSIILMLSLESVRAKSRRLATVLGICILVIVLINSMPFKDIINNSLWTTEKIHKSISFPQEYFSFMQFVKENVDPTTNILSIPFNIGGYAFIKDENENAVYAGTSPVKLFSGVNDISGSYSFPAGLMGQEIKKWWRDLDDKKYENILKTMYRYRMSYVIVTNNIPAEVKTSYLFDRGYKIKNQDNDLIEAITEKKIFSSKNGNFDLYKSKIDRPILEGMGVSFQKINSTKYLISLKNINGEKELRFLESYHPGWALYPVSYTDLNCQDSNIRNCRFKDRLFEGEELSYLVKHEVFGGTHNPYDSYFNSWVISNDVIKDKSFPHTVNKDGSVNASFVLYFRPQMYFYLGTIITGFIFISAIFYFFKYEKKN